jgi:hypothetical protein
LRGAFVRHFTDCLRGFYLRSAGRPRSSGCAVCFSHDIILGAFPVGGSPDAPPWTPTGPLDLPQAGVFVVASAVRVNFLYGDENAAVQRA